MLSGVQDRLAPLQAWLFPRRVYLQLDDQAITALALAGRQLRWLERVPLPEGLCQGGEPQLVEALGDLIGDLLIERGYTGARLRAVLPPQATEWRLVQWPGGQWPELPEALLLQRQEELGFQTALQAADLLPVPLPQAAPSALVVAVRQSLLEAWIDTFALAGVALDGLEAAPLCLCRAVEPLLAEGSADGAAPLTALVQLGAPQSALLVLRDGQPVYEWALPASTEAEALAAQLQRCLAFWRQQDPAAGALALVVHGAGAADGALVAQLSTVLAAPARLLDPLALGWLQGEPEPGAPQGLELPLLWGLAAAELS